MCKRYHVCMSSDDRSVNEAASDASGEAPATIEAELLELLVCPLTRSKLRLDGNELVGEVGELRYPIRDGIPVLLVDEAKLPEGVATLAEFKAKFAEQIPHDSHARPAAGRDR